ncbi:MAG TPA: GH116 family glycosyl hydrolase [Verrucomicrobiae bacterium]|jgi:uncharacterized protein (DUF608 family)|nr:GH116 family glycosyl hydrolase [Verrucomicrobiae bacterium]
MVQELFDRGPAELKWREFTAAGFDVPVCGVVFRAGQATCGLPLGGIGAGCLDLNTDGALGRCSIFNSFTPPRELNAPIFALGIGGKTWTLQKRAGADNAAEEIYYWGHYPVADLQFVTSAPVAASLRAWAPFLPGDAIASNTPGAVFEVHLRNSSADVQFGTLYFSFPGPSPAEAGGSVFERKISTQGVTVTAPGGTAYALALLDEDRPRVGGYLDLGAASLKDFVSMREASANDAGATVAVDFNLKPGESRTIRFALAWFAPRWKGTEYRHYLHAYSRRFSSAEDVVEYLTRSHRSLLQRILSWQRTIYAEKRLPVWLRDQMVNVLHTVTEDSFWAANSVPREDWCEPFGIFGLTESPRSVPHVAIPSDWYGSFPLVFFFPDLMAALLRGYAHFQLGNGEIPLGLGWGTDLGSPIYHFLHTVNSAVFVELVARLWRRGANPAALKEFYPAVKQAVLYTKSLDRDGDGLLDLEPEPTGNQFYGAWPWPGTSVHTNGYWLPVLTLAAQMAEAYGDAAFASQCREWRAHGQRTIEDLWRNGSYLLYLDQATGRSSDTVLANQLVGQWLSFLHGLPPMFPTPRAEAVLDTVKALHFPKSEWGIYNALRPDGAIDPTGSTHSQGTFPAENLCVAMTFSYMGRRAEGEDLARRVIENLVLRQGVGWDLPNQINPKTGAVTFGTDFYQMMIIWALPLAFSSEDIPTATRPGSLMDRILQAAKENGATVKQMA